MNIPNLCRGMGFEPRTALEVGAGPGLVLRPHAHIFKKLIIIDPVQEMIAAHLRKWDLEGTTELEAHVAAIQEKRGTATMALPANAKRARAGGGRGFVRDGPAAPVERTRRGRAARRRWATREVPAAPLADFDDGKIDVAVVDVEGNEYTVLKTMVSRPRIILVEIVPNNTYRREIMAWMEANNYHHVASPRRNHLFIRPQ